MNEKTNKLFDVIQTVVMTLLFVSLVLLTIMFFYNKSLKSTNSNSSSNNNSVLEFDDSISIYSKYDNCLPTVVALNCEGKDLALFNHKSAVSNFNILVNTYLYEQINNNNFPKISYDDFYEVNSYIYLSFPSGILSEVYFMYNFPNYRAEWLNYFPNTIKFIYIVLNDEETFIYVGNDEVKYKYVVEGEFISKVSSLYSTYSTFFTKSKILIENGEFLKDKIVILFDSFVSIQSISTENKSGYYLVSESERRKLLDTFSFNSRKVKFNDIAGDYISYVESYNTLQIKNSIVFSTNDSYGININLNSKSDSIIYDYLSYSEHRIESVLTNLKMYNSIGYNFNYIDYNDGVVTIFYNYTIDNVPLLNSGEMFGITFKYIDNKLIYAQFDCVDVLVDLSTIELYPSNWNYSLLDDDNLSIDSICPSYVINDDMVYSDWFIKYAKMGVYDEVE